MATLCLLKGRLGHSRSSTSNPLSSRFTLARLRLLLAVKDNTISRLRHSSTIRNTTMVSLDLIIYLGRILRLHPRYLSRQVVLAFVKRPALTRSDIY